MKQNPILTVPKSAVLLARAVQVDASTGIEETILKTPFLKDSVWYGYKWTHEDDQVDITNLFSHYSMSEALKSYTCDKSSFVYRISNMEKFVFQRDYLLMGYQRGYTFINFELKNGEKKVNSHECILSLLKIDQMPLLVVTLSMSLINATVDDLIFIRRSIYRDDVETKILHNNRTSYTSFRCLCDEIDKSKFGKRRLSDIETTFSSTELLLSEQDAITLSQHEKYGLLRCDEGYLERPSKKVTSFLHEHLLPEETGIEWYADDLNLLILNNKKVDTGKNNPIPVDNFSISSRLVMLPLFCHNITETLTYYKGTLELILTHSANLLDNQKNHSVLKLAKIQKRIAMLRRKSIPLKMRESEIYPIIIKRPRIQELIAQVDSILADAKESVDRESNVRSLFVAHLLNAIFCFGAIVSVEAYLFTDFEFVERLFGVLASGIFSILLFIFLRIKNG